MSSTPVLACLWVHFILQVSSILRAEPNSRACGSAKKDFSFFEDNRIFLNRSRNMSSTPSGPLLSAHNFFQYFSN